MLLRGLAVISLLVLIAMLVRDYLADGTAPSRASLTLVVLVGLAAVLVFGKTPTELRHLRAIELTAVLGLALFFALRLSSVLANSDPADAVAAWNRSLLHFALITAAYGLFVPKTGIRAAAVMLPIAAAPFVAALATPGPAAQILRSGQLIDGAVLMLVAFAVSLLASLLVGFLLDKMSEKLLETQYDLLEKVGAGGMGEVWLARHRALARPAAIKLIRPEVISKKPREAERTLRRFEREAQITAALRSPNTVEIYDFGVSKDGTFYYVMEYLEGWDLDALVRQHGPLKPERAIYLLDQLCESLADAHAHKLIHRDIKPANLHASRLGSSCDFLKVLDFGLVKEEGDNTQAAVTVSAEGTLTGTPAFISPEMAVGDRQIDLRSDIYAVGCVAYWLLTGRLVFEETTPVRIALAHATAEPTPPSLHTELDIPEELDRIVLRCLAKDPDHRFQSVRELQDALAAVPTAGAWDRRRAERWWSGHRPTRLALAG